jgi:hypothetical protein
VCRLPCQSADGLLASGDAWQQVLAVLRAQGEDRPTFERVYVEALRRLETLADQDHVRWHDLLRIILSWGLWRRPRDESTALQAAAQAAQTDAKRQKEVGFMAQTIAESIWQEGQAAGELRASRRMLLQFLISRFGALPEGVVQRIESCTDLERLVAAAQQVTTLDKPEDLQL